MTDPMAALDRLGHRRARLLARLAAVDAEALPVIAAAKAAGVSDERIAAALRTTRNTVAAWRRRDR